MPGWEHPVDELAQRVLDDVPNTSITAAYREVARRLYDTLNPQTPKQRTTWWQAIRPETPMQKFMVWAAVTWLALLAIFIFLAKV